MNDFMKRAIREIFKSVLVCTAYCLFALALFAVFVRAFAPSSGTITVVNWLIKFLGVFLCSLLFVRSGRAFFKGAVSGVCAVVLTMIVFGLIGGFHLSALFLAELLLGAVIGGAGAVCGAKIRKEQ